MKTYVKVTISTDIPSASRPILGNFLAKAFNELDNPQDEENVSFTGYVDMGGFVALCVLEGKGILTIDLIDN